MTASVTITNTSNRGEIVMVRSPFARTDIKPGQSQRVSVRPTDDLVVNLTVEEPEIFPKDYEDWQVKAKLKEKK